MIVPLPPLPPAFGGADAGPSGPTVTEVLAGEHRRVVALCARLTGPGDAESGDAGQGDAGPGDAGPDHAGPGDAESGDGAGPGGGPSRRQVAEVVTAALSRHLSAEEQYLYPAVRAAVPDGDQLADREIAEDRAILVTLRQLAATPEDDPEFDRLAGAVATQVRRHVEGVDRDLLPLLAAVAPADDLVRLGNRVETAEEAAPTRPHPGTPATPPWNKVVDPALGVVDKLRDAVTGRVTYPQDL